MRLSLKKIGLGSVALMFLSCAAFQIFSIRQSAKKTLAETRARLNEHGSVPFEKKILTPHLSDNIRILQNTNETRDLIKFKDSYFAATGGGLAQFAGDGKLLKHFTVLDGLPESDLTCLAVFGGKLFIGTRTKNLVAFDGEKFENYVWTDCQAQSIAALLEADGRLLVGTVKGGLLEFNGREFTEIKADKARIEGINCLYKNDTKLFVGTFDNGLWAYENDVWTHFTTADGLPSNRIVGIIAKDKNLYVASDFGLAILQQKTFHTLAVLPSLSSLALRRNQIFITKDDGEIFTFRNSLREFSGKKDAQNARLIFVDETLWHLSNQGIAQISGAKIKSFNENENNALTDNFASALAFDANKNLWVGTFRRGIDVLSADGKKLKHLESDAVREINFLQSNGETVSAATASGLLDFKKDFSVENTTKKDGLPSNSINHFSGNFIGTAKGLAFRENGKIRVLSTVQNLPNNSVYTTAQIAKKVYAGTLGGLAEIEANRVVRTYKDSNSKLATNWVTSLIFTNERLFIGTYGGGVFELLPSGEIRSFESETGKFVVNPNAMFGDGKRLYIGTLTGAKVLDLQTQEWKTVKQILPAETVLSIAGDDRNIYFGTTNGIARVAKKYFQNGETE